MSLSRLDRRQLLAGGVASVGAATIGARCLAGQGASKPVAAVVTAYERNLHADVLIGKSLEGWKQDGGPGPRLKLTSMYVEQMGDKDLSRALARKHGVRLCSTIAEAVTAGTDGIPIEGVISIGEHGRYPHNEKGQHLYPRRRFFEQIADTLQRHGRIVPVFSDKHLGPVWSDALWMYRRARELQIPFMAGSSMTVGYRVPDATVPLGAEVKAAVGIGYSGLDIYGSHALEFFQCLVERRRGGEPGVAWVQCLEGSAAWKALDDGRVSQGLFDQALAAVPHESGDVRSAAVTLFLFQYVDGLLGAVFMLPEFAGGTSAAVQIAGRERPLVTRFDERVTPAFPHFAWLLKGIERMIHTGRPPYPVERTLLTSGVLDRALTSRFKNHARLETPELRIRYRPADYPHAPRPPLDTDPSRGAGDGGAGDGGGR